MTDRDQRLRKFLSWGGPAQTGITPHEAAKLLHQGKESKHDEDVIRNKRLAEIEKDARDSWRYDLKKRGR